MEGRKRRTQIGLFHFRKTWNGQARRPEGRPSTSRTNATSKSSPIPSPRLKRTLSWRVEARCRRERERWGARRLCSMQRRSGKGWGKIWWIREREGLRDVHGKKRLGRRKRKRWSTGCRSSNCDWRRWASWNGLKRNREGLHHEMPASSSRSLRLKS